LYSFGCSVIRSSSGFSIHDGHGILAEGLELDEEIGAAESEAAADARHAVDLGEGAKDDDVLVGGDHVDNVLSVGEVDVGFIDEEDAAFGLVLERAQAMSSLEVMVPVGLLGLQMYMTPALGSAATMALTSWE
jgi:hypothetical protein